MFKGPPRHYTPYPQLSLKSKLAILAQRIVEKFGKISTAFRAFDLRTRGFVTFADFAYIIDQMKLGLERDSILQIFTYMDTDEDNQLKYRDFCNLCAEYGMQQGPSGGASNTHSSAMEQKSGRTEFSKIIKQLRQTKPS